MDTFKNIMDTIYSSSEALTVIYVTGAVLLLIFIALLVVSLRKPKISKKESKKETKKEEIVEKTIETQTAETTENNKEEVKIFETEKQVTTNENKELETTSLKEKITNIPNINIKIDENLVSKALNNIEDKEIVKEDIEITKVDEQKLSADIPNVDEFVNDVVKKTYEKNEQFSSIYNTTNVKLEKVLDKLNVDENVKEAIVEKEEKTNDNLTNKEETTIVEESENIETNSDKTNTINSLDLLKKQLEEKNKKTTKEVDNKQDELKEKLANLKKEEQEPKQDEAINAEDLLKKLNAMKEK